MKEIGSREFQLTYQRLTEPVKVITRSGAAKTLGFFYPGDVPPALGQQETLFGSEPEQPGGDAKPEPDELEDIL